MIFQARFTKINDTLTNSKDFYSYHQNKFIQQKPPHRQDLHSNRFKQDTSQAEIFASMISRQLQADKQEVMASSLERRKVSKEKAYYHNNQFNVLQLNMPETEKQKKMLPPLKLIAERIKLKDKSNASKERNDTQKNSVVETPNMQKSLARKHTINKGMDRSDQKESILQEQESSIILQMGRTSSTPFIQKSKEDKTDNLTSRSQSPHQEFHTSSPLKKRKQIVKKPNIPSQAITQQTRTVIQLKEKKQLPQQVNKFLDSIDQPKKVLFRKKKKQDPFIIQQQNQQYEKMTNRHTTYRNFLVMINFSNNICVTSPKNLQVPAYSVYVGKGNNSSLIKTLFRQRWWWQELETPEQMITANLVWTQLKQNELFDNLITFNQDMMQSNESFIGSHEETVGDTSDSDLDIKTKSTLLIKSSAAHQRPPNYYYLKKIFNPQDMQRLMHYMDETNCKDSQIIYSDLTEKPLKEIKGVNIIQRSDSVKFHMHNHMEDNWHLGNKKALFHNMRHYFELCKEDYTKYIPVTFHIQKGMEDPVYFKFVEYYNKRADDIKEFEKAKYSDVKIHEKRSDKKKAPINLWIIKPGELTNRGNGITVCGDMAEINKLISEEVCANKPRTYIVQQYLDNPLLYNKRKFDIRCYMLLTSQNGIFKGYWYQEGYIRTSSKEFTTKSLNKFVHLTNDAVQNKAEEYGKFESGNKISFLEFQRYLDLVSPQKYNFFGDLYPKMKGIALDLIKATYGKIDPNRRGNTFELYGLDFMIDDNFKLWLIEANTNPCLELGCPLLSKIIPTMVENLFRIAVDPIFPPPFYDEWPQNKKLFIPDNLLENNKFEIIFDELVDKKQMMHILKDNKLEQDCFNIEEEEEEEEND